MNNPVTQIFEKFAREYLKKYAANIEQLKVIRCITACKTGQLGYNIQACKDCGTIHAHYNSCGNRHCPNCQAVNKDKWLFTKNNDVLPVTYHHTVFTVPAELRTLFKFNKQLLYNLLFKAAWQTIDDFSNNPQNKIQAEMGMIAILHTWKQDLQYHPHLHCIVPAGGITSNNKWKHSPSNGQYLFNVKALSKTFKGKFLHFLKQYYSRGELIFPDLKCQRASEYFYSLKEILYHKNWVVYSKKSFNNQQSVFEYIGRYTHRIAISNNRIKKVEDKSVTFTYTDRADHYKVKTKTVDGVTFIKLFLQHVLPRQFMKIRNYGFLASRNKTQKLEKLFQYFNLGEYAKPLRVSVTAFLDMVYGFKPNICKECGGTLITISCKERPGKRAPPGKNNLQKNITA